MTMFLNYSDWIFEQTADTSVSAINDYYERISEEIIEESTEDLNEYYSRAGGSNMPARPAKKTREEEMELAKRSSMKRVKIGNWLVKPTIHGMAQQVERVPGVSTDQWMKLHQKMVDTLGKITDIPKKSETEVIFYSKSMNQSYVVAHDPAKNELRIMTVLPPGNPFAKSGTKKIVMESSVDLYFADMDSICENSGNMEQISHDWESFYKTVEVDATTLGYVYDRSEVTKIVDSNDMMLALGDTVTLNVPMVSSSSPAHAQKLSYLNYQIDRA